MTIGPVIRILRKEVKKYKEPSVTRVAHQKDPFLVLVSCILSLRTKDSTTMPASERLFAKASTPKKMLSLSEKEIQKAIYPVSFFRVKARNIKRVSAILLEKHGGKVPSAMDDLLELPNVGRKTANITITLGFGKLGIAVDTHVHRISNRLGFVKTATPDETEFALRKKLPKKYWMEYNDLLVTWGQNVCVPISPKCSTCAVSRFCKRVGVITSR